MAIAIDKIHVIVIALKRKKFLEQINLIVQTIPRLARNYVPCLGQTRAINYIPCLLSESAKKVFGDEVNITLEGRRHFGAVIGSKEFKDQYCQEKVDKWLKEMESLAEISKSQPHAAYVAFTKGFKSKFTYYFRTIESFEEYVNPIEEVIHSSLFGRAEPLPEELKELVSLSSAQGGIGIPDLKRENLEQFNASLDITAPHVNSIVTKSSTIPARELMEERKCEINAKRRAAAKSRIDRIDESLSHDLLQAVQQTRDKGASSWGNRLLQSKNTDWLIEQAGV